MIKHSKQQTQKKRTSISQSNKNRTRNRKKLFRSRNAKQDKQDEQGKKGWQSKKTEQGKKGWQNKNNRSRKTENQTSSLKKTSSKVWSRNRKYPAPLKILTGHVKRHPDGFGFFLPEDSQQPDVYLPRTEMEGLMNNDKVKITVTRRQRNKSLFFGKTLQIIERAQKYVLGQYFPLNEHSGLLKDDSYQWGEDLKVQLSTDQKLQKGEWVQVKITDWPNSPKGFNGHLIGSLGTFPEALEDNIRIIQKHNILSIFSPENLKEAKQYPDSIPPEEINKRKDLRHFPFATIDGETAQDFDDAIYVSHQQTGGWILYIAIADVSYYTQPGSVMDKEAYLRGNSTYLPGLTIPMLPERLSNDLCSLKPHQDRLAFVVEMHFNANAEKTKSSFYTAIICSHARLNYGQAQDIIENFEEKSSANVTVDSVSQSVIHASQLAKALLNQRIKNQFINLDIPETEVKLNKKGEPLDIIKSHRLFSHQLIEELMLTTNQSVATYICKKSLPSLYRVHNSPKTEALALLESFIQSLGYKEQLVKPKLHKKISDLIHQFAGHPAEAVLQNMILRALPQAIYKNERQDHFGLNTSYYTHFTSPIRRYSDLIVHRILKAGLNGQVLPYSKEQLASIASMTSAGEQKSVKAERQIKDIKKARFIKKYLGKEMEGIISSITKFGFFVKLRLYDIEGLIRLNRLKGTWLFDPKLLQLKCKKTGKSLQIGDFTYIQIISSNIDTGQIDFELIKHEKNKNTGFIKEKSSSTDTS